MLSLRRVTKAGTFIPQIDGLRFIAILSVVLFHLDSNLGNHGIVPLSQNDIFRLGADQGKRGVELFFVISGFILGMPFAKAYIDALPRPSLKRYFQRRLTRLEPPYIINLIVCVALLTMQHKYTFKSLIPHFLLSLVYFHQLASGASNILNGVLWSLEVEVQFYCLAPFLCLLFAIRSPTRRLNSLLGCMVVTSLLSLPLNGTALRPTILYYVPFFLAGFVSLELYLRSRGRFHEVQSGWWDLASVLLWPVVWMMGANSRHILLPIIFIVLLLAAFRSKYVSRLLSLHWITDIGGMCYTIYLYHYMIISACLRLTGRAHFGHSFVAYYIVQACLVLPITLLICVGLFLAIERPCMDRQWPGKLKRYLSGNKKDLQPTTP